MGKHYCLTLKISLIYFKPIIGISDPYIVFQLYYRLHFWNMAQNVESKELPLDWSIDWRMLRSISCFAYLCSYSWISCSSCSGEMLGWIPELYHLIASYGDR